ncbi:MAG TPA: exodeoxyribonuclease III [Steroidobacteraceae bacterium]|nr:exodeoxyribonuclease III [Steroidobacteraceae bacterium]
MNPATADGGPPRKAEFSVATWNVNSLRVRGDQLLEWLRANSPDVVALQETKIQDPDFPHVAFTAAGYHSVFSGQKTYNGVALLSRHPMTEVVRDIPDFDDPPRRVLAATVGGFRVINLYVPNGQAPGSEKFAYKLKWLEALTRWLQREVALHPGLVVVGDFNVAPEDRDVHDPAAWIGCVHVSPEERAALGRITALGLVDAFRHFEQPEKSFSWWDYRQGGFRRNHGLRIDLVLAHRQLLPRLAGCRIDVEPRRVERASDHTPVLAYFQV